MASLPVLELSPSELGRQVVRYSPTLARTRQRENFSCLIFASSRQP
ncbi:hypothetical protein A2U01_0101879 [Trifolium medium]|uniref:Uncharacterized protein n=1 Tax=Trifolium medium TaxID=97028 RepID=A0A392UX94_9FABA|nr:hypothetical protein [Trifolium medium]